MMMKRLLPLLALVLAAALVSGQEAAPAGGELRGNERQFAGEVISTDVAGKTLTVKAFAVDSAGQSQEKTMVMPVEDSVIAFLETLNTGDKVTVLWRRVQGQPDVVIGLEKRELGPTGEQ